MNFNIFGAQKPSIATDGRMKEFKYGLITYSRLYSDSIYTGSYWDFFLPLPSLYKDPKVLIIGLGGGTIPYQMQQFYRQIKITAVEIDKRAIELAEKFLPKIKFQIVNADGIKFVEQNTGFDVIVLDAYIKDYIPRGFLDEKFISDAYKALTEKGILAINFALSIKNMIHMNSYFSKLKRYFGVYKLLSSHLFGNTILICSKGMDKRSINEQIKDNFNGDEKNRFIVEAYRDMVPI